MPTRISVPSDGVTAVYSVPFPYLNKSHAKVKVNGVLTTAFTWPTSSSLQLTAVPPAGQIVEIYRETPLGALTSYQTGSVLTKPDLETDSLQALYLVEELKTDKYDKAAVQAEIEAMGASGTAALLRTDLASTAAGKGAALVKAQQAGVNAAARTQQERNRDRLSTLDFIGYNLSETDGAALRARIAARTSTAADKANIVLGVQAACAAANARGGVAVYLPSGKYWGDGINVSGMHGLTVVGDGPVATEWVTDSATADVFVTTTETKFLSFLDFTITSSVTRTAGDFFDLALWKRGLISHVRMTRWFNAVNLPTYEHCTLFECYITDPSGLGDAIIAGTASTAGQGANLNILNCFIRGSNDETAGAPVGRYGIASYDVDAIFSVNNDIGGFVEGDLLIAPNARSANHYFNQTFFDATKNSDCIRMQGTGTKQQMTFNGCWLASAGKLAGGNVEACGLRATNAGSYQDINFTGTRIYNNSGSGALLEMPGADFHFSGGTFYFNGTPAVTNRHGFKWLPATVATVGPSIAGYRFASNATKDIYIGANGNGKHSIQGVHLETGIDQLATAAQISGSDPSSSTYASVATLTISPFHDYAKITGTVNISGMTATYSGHMVTLKFDAILVVVDASTNLALVGNFTTAAGSTLTLRCDGATWWEVARANT